MFGILPANGSNVFSVDKNRFSASPHKKLPELFNNQETVTGVEYYISLSSDIENNVSRRYKIINFEENISGWDISVEEDFGLDIAEFSDEPGGTNAPGIILNGTKFNMYKSYIENSPKFDGRFFVKIYRDQDFTSFIEDPVSENNPQYVINSNTTKKIYYCKSNSKPDGRTPEYHGAKAGSAGQHSVWRDYGTYGPNTFPFGDTATNPSITDGSQVAKLLDYWEIGHNCLDGFGDLDFNTGFSNNIDAIGVDPKSKYNMMAWHAYFRGINTESVFTSGDRVNELDVEKDLNNTKFEDVWFISDAQYSDGFHSDGFRVNENLPNTNSSKPTPWLSSITGGWVSYTNKSRLELAFGGIEPSQWPRDNTWPYTDGSFYDLEDGNINYKSTQGNFIDKLSAGSQFRFREDPSKTIYTITDVDIYNRIVYDNIDEYFDLLDNTSGAPGNPIGDGILDDPPPTNKLHYQGQFEAFNGNLVPNTSFNPTVDGVTYRNSSFFKASNFTKNYRLWLDKDIAWNPVKTHNQPIEDGYIITLLQGACNPVGSHDGNVATIELDSITGNAFPVNNQMRVQVGMVIDDYDDANTGVSGQALAEKAIVTKIDFDAAAAKYTIYLRRYDGGGSTLTQTGVDSIENIVAQDTIRFKQYCMNGLSPNSAKNLNYFNNGVVVTPGVMALGYTMEFVEQKSSSQDENVLPSNPAIWETEPKETKDLDIYHEASKAHYITDEVDIADLIPVGSTVEHLSSNAVPINTTVLTVDPLTGEIVLSNPVQITNNYAQDSVLNLNF